MSLLLGVSILALAVFLGGLAAVFREHGERAMPAIRTFAVVAAAAIALLHLLPEAVAAIGWIALLAALAGIFVPVALERLFLPQHAHAHDAPTTALAMGYAAVVAHQAGEGAAVASLARSGALSPSIVLAIAAHTVPLAMVVAIRVLEVKAGRGKRRATAVALAGVALATALGALAGNLVGAAALTAMEPWLLATVAGLLLHALSHDMLGATAQTLRGRVIDIGAGLLGLGIAMFGIEDGSSVRKVPWALRIVGVLCVAGGITLRGVFGKRHRESSTDV